ncbi:MAG: hypothetical protein IT385_16170 [Deltaproteobacteria bacterium]|nr:hypothetical protein [Deltaproteobacteria bacterium]
MLSRFTKLFVAGLATIFVTSCDDTWTPDDPATEEGALVLDEVTPVAAKVLDVKLIPTEELTSMHGMIEHRVLVQIMANYDPVPGPDPDPAEVLIDIRGEHIVTTHGMTVMLFDATPSLIHLAATVDAECLALPGCLELVAERIDLSGGVLTLEVVHD